MAVIKWLIKGYLFGHLCILIFPPLIYIFPFFNALSCIGGVLLFIYLYRTGQLVISKRVFFLLPHIILFGVIFSMHSPNANSSPDINVSATSKSSSELEVNPPPDINITADRKASTDVLHMLRGLVLLANLVSIPFGLPFLLYCFLQVTEGYRAVAARIFCFILPGLMLVELIAIVPQ